MPAVASKPVRLIYLASAHHMHQPLGGSSRGAGTVPMNLDVFAVGDTASHTYPEQAV